MEATTVCEYLAWDSAFFGMRIARVIPNQLDRDRLSLIMAWCYAERIRCLYFLGRSDDAMTVRLAEAHGFHFVDARLTLALDLASEPADDAERDQTDIRRALLADVPMLRAIAKESHRDTRFYYDGNFSSAQCDALYETWIEKSCMGSSSIVFVAELAGAPAGYLSCDLLESRVGQIGLLAVRPTAQGRGLGRRLLRAALLWFANQGVEQVTVVTQSRNILAQRLYQRHGFRTRSVQLWYHRWFDSVEAVASP